MVQAVRPKKVRKLLLWVRCAAGRPNPQLMSALLSEESRLYSFLFSNVECVPVKGFQEKRHRHGQSCFISFPRIPHRSLISLFFSGGIFSLLVPLWAPALCLISGSRLTSTSERKYDRSFEGLILSSLSLSAPHLVSFTSFFLFFFYNIHGQIEGKPPLFDSASS